MNIFFCGGYEVFTRISYVQSITRLKLCYRRLLLQDNYMQHHENRFVLEIGLLFDETLLNDYNNDVLEIPLREGWLLSTSTKAHWMLFNIKVRLSNTFTRLRYVVYCIPVSSERQLLRWMSLMTDNSIRASMLSSLIWGARTSSMDNRHRNSKCEWNAIVEYSSVCARNDHKWM